MRWVRTASVEDDTHPHNLPQQATAYPPRPDHGSGALAWPIRRSRFGSLEGAPKHRAAGMGLAPIPWRQAKCAAPQARRREGLKPNGRDGKDGTGRSPIARRRTAPARPDRSIFSASARRHRALQRCLQHRRL